MKITTKINLITSAWILCVLLAVNSVVFFSFMKVTLNIEQGDLHERSQNIISEINRDASPAVIKETLSVYLTSHAFIRIVNEDSKIVNQVYNDHYLATKVKAKFVNKTETKRMAIRQKRVEQQIIVYRVPYKVKGHKVETIEIAERISGLELAKDVLLSILSFCTILGAVISLLGGRWLSNIIMRPISDMINTMEDIEQSGTPKRIVIQHDTKDELQKMAVTFNRMIGRLDANLEKQKQFISDASHELKTPLTVIKSYADLLRRRGIRNEEVTLEAIESIHSEATRIQKMTERFLDLANTELENVLDLKSINLIALCQNILKQLRGAYKREISLFYNESPITVIADELKLKQVIIILLDNAIKYSSDQIDVYLEDLEQFTAIRVKDYGIGIHENELENIFERFYRVDKARSRATGGTGLGLSIAKNIMKQHNGEIKVKSKDGIGTEMELLLPKKHHEGKGTVTE
jgi:two-component system, OmpR family, sensor histidine kinase ArlS